MNTITHNLATKAIALPKMTPINLPSTIATIMINNKTIKANHTKEIRLV
jgi:hypothetical protein